MASLTNIPTGTDETTVSTGNSAAGGSAWNLVTIGTTGVLVYDDVSGTTWYRCSTGVTSAMVRADWTSTSITPAWSRVYGRVYFMIPAANLGAVIYYLSRGRAGTTQSFRLSVSTGSRLVIRNTTNGSAATGGVPIAGDTVYRVEWDITVGAAAVGTAKLYLGDSTTELETVTAAAGNFGTANVDEVGYGIASSTANHPSYWLRGFNANDTTMPGPQSAGAVTVNLTAATLTLAPQTLTPTPGPVTVDLAPALLTLGAVALTPVPQPVTVPLSPAEVVLTAVAVTPTPGPVTVALAPAVLTFTAQPLSLGGNIIFRPDDGPVIRPITTTVTRPSTGTVVRPDTGLVVRP